MAPYAKTFWEPSTGICAGQGGDSCSDLCGNCSTRIVWTFGGGGDEGHGLKKRGLRRRMTRDSCVVILMGIRKRRKRGVGRTGCGMLGSGLVLLGDELHLLRLPVSRRFSNIVAFRSINKMIKLNFDMCKFGSRLNSFALFR